MFSKNKSEVMCFKYFVRKLLPQEKHYCSLLENLTKNVHKTTNKNIEM